MVDVSRPPVAFPRLRATAEVAVADVFRPLAVVLRWGATAVVVAGVCRPGG